MKNYEERINKINSKIKELKNKLTKEVKENDFSIFEYTETTELTKEDKLLKQLEKIDVGNGYKCIGYLDGGYPNIQEEYTEEQLKDLEIQLDSIEKEIEQ